jgi:hypothetical protein
VQTPVSAWSGGWRKMPRFKVGDTVVLDGRRATVVWLSENANEIEAIDEYIVEFEDRRRQFATSSTLPQKAETVRDREHQSDSCCGQKN